MKQFILAIDQGTTGTTVIILDSDLNILAKSNAEFNQYYPQPGWVEHDADEIWQSTLNTITSALSQAQIPASAIGCIGITNQRETTTIWDKRTAKPIHKSIVWQDRRTAAVCERLKKKGLEKKIRSKTGLVLDPYFSATKAAWILDHVPQARELAKKNHLAFGTIDSWLVYRLTNGAAHVTDISNASRTSLFNIVKEEWDSELLKIFNVPATILPTVVANAGHYGVTHNVPGLPDGIPITGMAGDQQAALFGQAAFQPGDAKCTYGTGSFLLMNIGSKPILSKRGLVTTIAWRLGSKTVYALEGSSFIAGAAVQWLRDGLKIISSSSEIENLAKSVPDNGGVYFVPALAGLGAPHWNPEARGVIHGITRGTTRGHIARATLEGIAYQQMEILEIMQKDSGKKCLSLRVDGGASANNLMMQFQADILGVKIVRPKTIETTALGAAFLAGLGAGIWKSADDIKKAWKQDIQFTPSINTKQRSKLREIWGMMTGKA